MELISNIYPSFTIMLKRILLFCLICITKQFAFSQTPTLEEFKGKWKTDEGRDQVKLNFLDSARMTVEIGKDFFVEGSYSLKMRIKNEDIILTVHPKENPLRDSLVFLMAKQSPGLYRLKNVIRFFNDKPPEVEILDGKEYYLKEEGTSSSL